MTSVHLADLNMTINLWFSCVIWWFHVLVLNHPKTFHMNWRNYARTIESTFEYWIQSWMEIGSVIGKQRRGIKQRLALMFLGDFAMVYSMSAYGGWQMENRLESIHVQLTLESFIKWQINILRIYRANKSSKWTVVGYRSSYPLTVRQSGLRMIWVSEVTINVESIPLPPCIRHGLPSWSKHWATTHAAFSEFNTNVNQFECSRRLSHLSVVHDVSLQATPKWK